MICMAAWSEMGMLAGPLAARPPGPAGVPGIRDVAAQPGDPLTVAWQLTGTVNCNKFQ